MGTWNYCNSGKREEINSNEDGGMKKVKHCIFLDGSETLDY
jgi:hypothetical protein